MNTMQWIWLTGAVNFLSILLVLLTCRCSVVKFPALIRQPVYNSLNRYHCVFWWVFIASMLVHGYLALVLFGVPF